MQFKISSLVLVVLLATLIQFQATILAECRDNGVAQGISCLHCMDSRAKGSTLKLVSALGDSCLSNVALAFVLDGSFGIDQNIIKNSIDLLIKQDKKVTLHLYFLNGSAIRKADSKMFSGFLNNIPPAVLREKIKNNAKTQANIKKFIQGYLPLIRLAYHKGVKISLCPMLEDNLDDESFKKLLSIARAAVPAALKVIWTRNPCPDCFTGNQSGVPSKVNREDHYGELPIKPLTSISSNDGWGFIAFQSDKLLVPSSVFSQGRFQKSLRLDDLADYRNASIAKGVTFLLWLSKYQATKMAQTQLAWKDRELPLPTSKELSEITEFFGTK